MIRIAVCDDENVIVNQIEHIISEVCKRESIPVNIDVFYSGRELKRQVTSGTKYDIIFLDIQMKGGDGITAAENIRKVDDNVLLIYVSGYDKYMMELFRLDVFGFIKKPIDEEILTKTFLETYQRVCSKMVYFTFSYKHEEYKKLIDTIHTYQPNAKCDDVLKAFELADKAHGNQQRVSGEPYILHPLAVAQILAELQIDTTTITASAPWRRSS